MALTFLKRTEVPASVKGKVASDPSISISDKGQISLNTLATKLLNGKFLLLPAFDSGKLYLFTRDSKVKAVAAYPDSEFFTLRASKKGGTASFAGTNMLRNTKLFGDNLYDFGASGNQTFAVTNDEKNGALVITLPKGSLAKRAVTPRKKKAKVTSIKAEAGSTEAMPVESDDLILESA